MKHYTLGTAEISPGVGGKWADLRLEVDRIAPCGKYS